MLLSGYAPRIAGRTTLTGWRNFLGTPPGWFEGDQGRLVRSATGFMLYSIGVARRLLWAMHITLEVLNGGSSNRPRSDLTCTCESVVLGVEPLRLRSTP